MTRPAELKLVDARQPLARKGSPRIVIGKAEGRKRLGIQLVGGDDTVVFREEKSTCTGVLDVT